MKVPYKEIMKLLKQLNKEEIIEFTIILYRKFHLEEDKLDYTKLSDVIRGLLFQTVGVNYNNMHPTKESQEKEDSTEWFTKIGVIPKMAKLKIGGESK